MIGLDLACALDPVQLARRVGLTLDDWQADLVRSQATQVLMLCSRQSGKSLTAALLATHRAEFYPGSLVLVLSPSLRQSQESFRKVVDLRSALGGEACPAAEESALRLELSNGSRVISLPDSERTIRGYSRVDLLVIDEASRVRDATYGALRPMLATSGGRIILLSTPAGARGFFWREWTEGGADWHRAQVTAHDCPRIPRAWLEAERERIGSLAFASEFMCEFTATGDSVFGLPLLRGAVAAVAPLFSDNWTVNDALRSP